MSLIITIWHDVLLKILLLVRFMCILVQFLLIFLDTVFFRTSYLTNCNSTVLILSTAYLGSLEGPEITELLLNEYRNATNMTDQFSALVAIDQQPAIREEILADFYNKWQDDFLVTSLCFYCLHLDLISSLGPIKGNLQFSCVRTDCPPALFLPSNC